MLPALSFCMVAPVAPGDGYHSTLSVKSKEKISEADHGAHLTNPISAGRISGAMVPIPG